MSWFSFPGHAPRAIRSSLASIALCTASGLFCPAVSQALGFWHPPMPWPPYPILPTDDNHLDLIPEVEPSLKVKCGLAHPPGNGGLGPNVMTQAGFGFVNDASPLMSVFGFAAGVPNGSDFFDIAAMYESQNDNSGPVPINMIGAANVSAQIVTRAQWNAGFNFAGSSGWTKPNTTGSAASFNALFGAGSESALVFWATNSAGTPIPLNSGFDLKMMATASTAMFPETGLSMPLAAFGNGATVTGSTTFVPEPTMMSALILAGSLCSQRRRRS